MHKSEGLRFVMKRSSTSNMLFRYDTPKMLLLVIPELIISKTSLKGHHKCLV